MYKYLQRVHALDKMPDSYVVTRSVWCKNETLCKIPLFLRDVYPYVILSIILLFRPFPIFYCPLYDKVYSTSLFRRVCFPCKLVSGCTLLPRPSPRSTLLPQSPSCPLVTFTGPRPYVNIGPCPSSVHRPHAADSPFPPSCTRVSPHPRTVPSRNVR